MSQCQDFSLTYPEQLPIHRCFPVTHSKEARMLESHQLSFQAHQVLHLSIPEPSLHLRLPAIPRIQTPRQRYQLHLPLTVLSDDLLAHRLS